MLFVKVRCTTYLNKNLFRLYSCLDYIAFKIISWFHRILKEHHHHPDFHHGDFHHHGGYGGFDGGYGGSFGGFGGGGGWGDFGGWGLEGHDEMGLASENNEAKFALGE